MLVLLRVGGASGEIAERPSGPIPGVYPQQTAQQLTASQMINGIGGSAYRPCPVIKLREISGLTVAQMCCRLAKSVRIRSGGISGPRGGGGGTGPGPAVSSALPEEQH